MAKRERSSQTEQSRRAATESKIEEFAEDLGRLLGTARAKADGWLGQRESIAKHLTEIRDTAHGLLQKLSGENPFPLGKGGRREKRRGMEVLEYAPAPQSKMKRRKISAKAKAAIAAAQKKRWAKWHKQKEAAEKKVGLS